MSYGLCERQNNQFTRLQRTDDKFDAKQKKEKMNCMETKKLNQINLLKAIFFFICLGFIHYSYGQNYNRFSQKKFSHRFPIWTFHEKNVNIHGVSVGLWSFSDNERNTNTNGIRLELIGLGIASLIAPEFPTFGRRSERINGLNVSALGTVGDCLINGISVGSFGQILEQVNGVTLSAILNIIEKQNGIMIAVVNHTVTMDGFQFGATNNASKINGVQVGFINQSEILRGIQIGIWNINQKRKLPLINWNFQTNFGK